MYEGQAFRGPQAIAEKLTSLPFSTIQHSITTKDCAVTVNNDLLIMVLGQLKADADHVHGFSQTFLLKQIGDGLFIMNDIFRLALHHAA